MDSVISSVARHYLHLQLAGDVGPVRVRNLVHHFGSIEAVLGASQAELQRVERVGPKVAEAVFGARGDERANIEIERAASCGVRILCCEDPAYPEPLKRLPDPPICLYVLGELTRTDTVAVGIVGTRRCSRYGLEQAERFAELLGRAGFTVVSGLARGIDGHAHRGAMRAGGRTVAVLGNGLGTIYPREHESLAREIFEGGAGALVSELAIDYGPDAKNFPPRNRIIAGMSLGVLVVEAGQRSGSLITARLANEYNREVFALPGRIDQPDRTAGSNGLIRDGSAKLVTCLDDILDEFGDVGAIMAPPAAEPGLFEEGGEAREPAARLTEGESAVLQAAQAGHEDIDAIATASGLATHRVSAHLTLLQLKGFIKQLPGGRFIVRSAGASA